jgi:hypothetical protein
MLLKDFRKHNRLSQVEMCFELSAFIKKTLGMEKKLAQRTLAYWELGVMPRRFWRDVIEKYSDGQVTADDFAHTPAPKQAGA